MTHRAIEIIDYDPNISGKPEKLIVEETSRGVFYDYTQSELADESILPTDVRLIVLQDEFPSVPNVDDEIIRLDTNRTYKIVNYGEDPALATYDIQLRSMAHASQ